MARESRLPQRIGKYELGEALGRGTCGIVHRAHDPFVDRDVALKIAHPGETAKMLQQSGRQRRTFFSEAHAAAQLTHPHIVAVYDAGMEGPYSYIVMEFVPGDTLRRWGHGGRERLPVDRVVDIAFRCCRALDYAHGRGIVHRDIKPSNVLIAADGGVKITDFSIALLSAQQEAGQPGVAEGTPHYMAPEQVRGSGIGPAADLYALGVVMFELLAGRVPFADPDMKRLFAIICDETAPPLAEAAPGVPAELAAIVDRLLRKDPAERHASGAELAAALGRVHDRLRRSERQLAKAEHRNLLRGLGFFDGFGENEIDALLEASSLLQFRAGEPIVREGELESSFYILAAGSARVEKGGVAIETLGKGDCFGEMGFVAEARRSATITAATDTIVLRLVRSSIDLAPMETQLLYYRTFAETLVYRLAVTSARLAAALKSGSGQ